MNMFHRHPISIALLATLIAVAFSFPSSLCSPSIKLSRAPTGLCVIVSERSRLASSPNRLSRSKLQMSLSLPMRPMEEEKEKESNKINKRGREWKEVVGGFVPKFLKRSPANEENTIQDEDTRTAPVVHTVDTLEEYKNMVVDEANKIVVVRFFAPWCKSCKAAEPHFRKLASQHSSAVKFVEVPLNKDTAYIHEGLGVPSVPFSHIYHPEVGLVEELKINKKVFREFKDTLESYIRGECEIPVEAENDSSDDSSFQ